MLVRVFHRLPPPPHFTAGGPGGPLDRRSVPSFVKAQQASKSAEHPVDAAREGFASAVPVPLRPSPRIFPAAPASTAPVPPGCEWLAVAEALQAALSSALLVEDARPGGKGQKERSLVDPGPEAGGSAGGAGAGQSASRKQARLKF